MGSKVDVNNEELAKVVLSRKRKQSELRENKTVFTTQDGQEKFCTFSDTGQQHVEQDWYHCLTCGLIEQNGVCAICAKTCHFAMTLFLPRAVGFTVIAALRRKKTTLDFHD